ncbi:(+)-delta-cadinene synthase isozyme A-like [Gossypium australe]|uniref:(+)-delta-cadinene synthase isozyme A-like n=1 Tax=Gossypium australe TaxID=47621 RepID=A0A5B6VTM5_9ROSI|nr:(+)-delta-cadinene synthase isozyme A-like [Gossypium australe]
MFNKFIDEKGKFKESLIIDMKGMLELYEVAHFQLHGETILEEALAFTMFHLKSTKTTMDYPLSTRIADALKQPLHKSLSRLVAWSYIPIYEGYGTLDKNLKIFAKLDFYHGTTFTQGWWKGLDVATSFPFIRDGLVECCFGILRVYFKPHYTIARTFMTKVISLTSILDDIYNAYGTSN